MKEIDVRALRLLKAYRNSLTKQQHMTLRGQVLAGDSVGAMRGLRKVLERNETHR